MEILRKISLWVKERLEPKDPLDREISRLENAILSTKFNLEDLSHKSYRDIVYDYGDLEDKLKRQELWLKVLYDRRASRKSKDKV